MAFRRGRTAEILFALGCALPTTAWAESWQPVTDQAQLRALISDTTLTGTLRDGVEAIGRYKSDGSATLEAWGDTFARSWRIEGERICLTIDT